MNKSVYRILKNSELSNNSLIALEILKDKKTPLLSDAMEKAKIEQAPKFFKLKISNL